jgi:hypothetical protein
MVDLSWLLGTTVKRKERKEEEALQRNFEVSSCSH